MSFPLLLSQAVSAISQLGHEHARLGRIEAALSCFRMAFALDDNHFSAMIDSANCLRELGRLDDAESDLLVVLNANPDNPWALHSLGVIRQRQGDDAQAAECFLRAASVDGAGFENDSSNTHLAMSLSRLGRHKDALDLLKACMERRPDDLSLLISLAETSLNLGDFVGAVDASRKAISLDGNHPTAVVSLVRSLEGMGLQREAQEALSLGKQRLGFVPEIWALELGLLRSQGRIAEAYKIVQDVVDKDEHLSASIFFSAAIFFIESGYFENADRLISKAPSSSAHEKAHVEFVHARLSLFRGEFDASLSHYRQVQLLNPDWNLSLDYAQLGLWSLNLPLAYEALSLAASPSAAHRAAISHYNGVLFNYQRSQSVIERFQYLAATALQPKMKYIAQMVREHPESVPLAVAFLRALVDSGSIGLYTSWDRSDTDNIPRNIVQYWESDIPDDVRIITEQWATMNPEYNYSLYDFKSAGDFIKENFPDHIFQGFADAPQPARRANIFRYAYLYLHGGVYVDADERCLIPLSEWLPHSVKCVAAVKDLGVLNCNFVAIAAGSAVMKTALEGAVSSIINRNVDPLWLTNGPGRFTTSLATYAAEMYDGNDLDMIFLDRNEEQQFFATDFTLLYKSSPDHWWLDEYHKAD